MCASVISNIDRIFHQIKQHLALSICSDNAAEAEYCDRLRSPVSVFRNGRELCMNLVILPSNEAVTAYGKNLEIASEIVK